MAAAVKRRGLKNPKFGGSNSSFERVESAFSTENNLNISVAKDDVKVLEDPNQVWLEADLMQNLIPNIMQKARVLRRHVTMTSSCIFWTKPGMSSVICSILFSDVAGLYYNGMTEDEKMYVFRDHSLFQREFFAAQDDSSDPLSFSIHTSYCGFHRGNIFRLKANSSEQKDLWVSTLCKVFRIQKRKPWNQMSWFEVIRKSAKNMYAADGCQIFVATLISANFLLNIVEAEIRPDDGSDASNIISDINIAFTSVFTAELALNFYANFWLEFIRDAWNWFDSVVVIVSVVSLLANNLPGISFLRLLRALRVFRLFKRIPSLRQVLIALNMSIPKMMNAFVLVCLGAAIYSIVGVTFFKDAAPDYFGDFFTAMFTMFQVLTGDAWGDLARNLMATTGSVGLVGMYFVSFHLIVVLVLLNVVIAILLDEFSKAARIEKDISESGGHDFRNQPPQDRACPLERMAQEFSAFDRLEYIDQAIDFAWSRISAIACNIENSHQDPGFSETLDFNQLSEGLKEFGYIPPILFKQNHWDRMIVRTGLSSGHSQINVEGFRVLIRRAIWRYHLNQLSMAIDVGNKDWDTRNVRATFLSLKGILFLEYEADRNDEAETNDLEVEIAVEKHPEDSFDGLLQFLDDLGTVRTRFEKIERDLRELREEKSFDCLKSEVVKVVDAMPAARDTNNNFDFFRLPSFETNFGGIFGTNIFKSFGFDPASSAQSANSRDNDSKSNPLLRAGAFEAGKQASSARLPPGGVTGKGATMLSNLTDTPILAIMNAFGQKTPANGTAGILEGFQGIGKGIMDGFDGIAKGLDDSLLQNRKNSPESAPADASRL